MMAAEGNIADEAITDYAPKKKDWNASLGINTQRVMDLRLGYNF